MSEEEFFYIVDYREAQVLMLRDASQMSEARIQNYSDVFVTGPFSYSKYRDPAMFMMHSVREKQEAGWYVYCYMINYDVIINLYYYNKLCSEFENRALLSPVQFDEPYISFEWRRADSLRYSSEEVA